MNTEEREATRIINRNMHLFTAAYLFDSEKEFMEVVDMVVESNSVQEFWNDKDKDSKDNSTGT